MTSPAEGTIGVNPPADVTLLCTHCGEHPRAQGQRWCRGCRAQWKRERRRQAKQAALVVQGSRGEIQSAGQDPQYAAFLAREQARQAYVAATQDYQLARTKDWHRMPVAPGGVLLHLLSKVNSARQRCLALGFDPDEPNGEQRGTPVSSRHDEP